MSSQSVEQELHTLFTTAYEDLKKGGRMLESRESLLEVSNRFLKVAKRLHDIYKLFEDEFGESIDVIAAKGMLHFTRTCFIVSHILMNTDWLKVKEVPSVSRKMATLPKRALRRMAKRTILKKRYVFNCSDEDYARSGFLKINHEQMGSKRNYCEELYNVAIGLKNLGNKLCILANASGIVESKARWSDLGGPPDDKTISSLHAAKEDLTKSHNIMKDYYIAVIVRLDEVEKLIKEGTVVEAEVNYDECLIPLMKRFGMKSRVILRGDIGELRKPNYFLDVSNTEADILETSRLIASLDNGPVDAFPTR